MKPLMLIPPNSKKVKGFTLIEMVMVMVLLGVMAVGIGSFISLATQTYVNVSARDELIASARFAIERLNREIRNAVPNSVRVTDINNENIQCIEFIPIVASTTYIDIPVSPEPVSSNLTVIQFTNADGDDYSCTPFCFFDKITVYPLDSTDIYADSMTSPGKVFRLGTFNPPFVDEDIWTLPITFVGGVQFVADSPTKRAYVFNDTVSYCANYVTKTIRRYQGDFLTATQETEPTVVNNSLMAEYINKQFGKPSFKVIHPTLQRNSIVQISLEFKRDDEAIVFDQEIHITNVP